MRHGLSHLRGYSCSAETSEQAADSCAVCGTLILQPTKAIFFSSPARVCEEGAANEHYLNSKLDSFPYLELRLLFGLVPDT